MLGEDEGAFGHAFDPVVGGIAAGVAGLAALLELLELFADVVGVGEDDEAGLCSLVSGWAALATSPATSNGPIIGSVLWLATSKGSEVDAVALVVRARRDINIAKMRGFWVRLSCTLRLRVRSCLCFVFTLCWLTCLFRVGTYVTVHTFVVLRMDVSREQLFFSRATLWRSALTRTLRARARRGNPGLKVLYLRPTATQPPRPAISRHV